jgi:DNA repair exonuclease SbcCD ATPase subunit
MSESAHRLAKKSRKQSQSPSISNVGVGGDSISDDLVHDVHCLKSEVQNLKLLMKDQSSNVVIVEELSEKVESAVREMTSAQDDLISLREEIENVKRLSQTTKRSPESAGDSKSHVGANDLKVSSDVEKLKHDFHCLKDEMNKVKRKLKSKGSETGVVKSRDVDADIKMQNDIEEIREEVKSATRQAAEVKDDLNELREEFMRIHNMSEASHRLAKKARKYSRRRALANANQNADPPNEVLNDSIAIDLRHDIDRLKSELQKQKSLLKDKSLRITVIEETLDEVGSTGRELRATQDDLSLLRDEFDEFKRSSGVSKRSKGRDREKSSDSNDSAVSNLSSDVQKLNRVVHAMKSELRKLKEN